jgi:hypothetical protein
VGYWRVLKSLDRIMSNDMETDELVCGWQWMLCSQYTVPKFAWSDRGRQEKIRGSSIPTETQYFLNACLKCYHLINLLL